MSDENVFQGEVVLVLEDSERFLVPALKDISDNRVRIYVAEPQTRGFSACLNYGLFHCRGEYIFRADIDDTYYKNKIPKQLRVAHQDDADIVFTDVHTSAGRMRFAGGNGFKIMLALGNNPINHTSVCFRNPLRNGKTMLYDQSLNFAEDFDLWCRHLIADSKIVHIDECLSEYSLLSTASKTRKNALAQISIRYKYARRLTILSLCLLVGMLPHILLVLFPINARVFRKYVWSRRGS